MPETERQEPTCADLVHAVGSSLEDDLERLMRRMARHWSKDSERAGDELFELPLSIEVEPVIRIIFGTGGPHREVEWKPGRDTWQFIYQDWFDGARCDFRSEGARDAIRYMIPDVAELVRSEVKDWTE